MSSSSTPNSHDFANSLKVLTKASRDSSGHCILCLNFLNHISPCCEIQVKGGDCLLKCTFFSRKISKNPLSGSSDTMQQRSSPYRILCIPRSAGYFKKCVRFFPHFLFHVQILCFQVQWNRKGIVRRSLIFSIFWLNIFC